MDNKNAIIMVKDGAVIDLSTVVTKFVEIANNRVRNNIIQGLKSPIYLLDEEKDALILKVCSSTYTPVFSSLLRTNIYNLIRIGNIPILTFPITLRSEDKFTSYYTITIDGELVNLSKPQQNICNHTSEIKVCTTCLYCLKHYKELPRNVIEFLQSWLADKFKAGVPKPFTQPIIYEYKEISMCINIFLDYLRHVMDNEQFTVMMAKHNTEVPGISNDTLTEESDIHETKRQRTESSD